MQKESIFSFDEAAKMLSMGITGFLFRNHTGHYQRAELNPSTGHITLANCTPTPETEIDFGGALNHLRAGKRVCRAGWNGKGMWLELQVPDAHSKMSLPYISMKTVTDDNVPWLASQTDMLATDWMVAP